MFIQISVLYTASNIMAASKSFISYYMQQKYCDNDISGFPGYTESEP